MTHDLFLAMVLLIYLLIIFVFGVIGYVVWLDATDERVQGDKHEFS